MEVLYPRCAALDVHKDMLVAAIRLAEGSAVQHEVRTFATTTPALLDLSAWLDEHACTHVVMEATGVYWRPVWQVLDADTRTLILANAAHVKNVPGRKTDVADAVWLCDLLAHGLIRASFVPEAQTKAMRDLLRTRKQLVREQASHVQRIQKTLEEANLKLASVLTDIMGVSGRAVLDALVEGECDPAGLQALVSPRVKAAPEAIRAALTGRIDDHHRFLLGVHLRQYDGLKAAIAEVDAQVERDLGPFREAVELLATIPGVSDLTAQVILSEIGLDMDRFPTAGHLISWAGLCPRNDESAESAARHGCARAPPGSRRLWSRRLGLACARREVPSRPSSSACAPGAGRRKPSAPWPPPCSRRSTTCSRPARPMSIPVLITSTRPRQPPEPRRSRDKSSASDLHAKSSP